MAYFGCGPTGAADEPGAEAGLNWERPKGLEHGRGNMDVGGAHAGVGGVCVKEAGLAKVSRGVGEVGLMGGGACPEGRGRVRYRPQHRL